MGNQLTFYKPGITKVHPTKAFTRVPSIRGRVSNNTETGAGKTESLSGLSERRIRIWGRLKFTALYRQPTATATRTGPPGQPR